MGIDNCYTCGESDLDCPAYWNRVDCSEYNVDFDLPSLPDELGAVSFHIYVGGTEGQIAHNFGPPSRAESCDNPANISIAIPNEIVVSCRHLTYATGKHDIGLHITLIGKRPDNNVVDLWEREALVMPRDITAGKYRGCFVIQHCKIRRQLNDIVITVDRIDCRTLHVQSDVTRVANVH
jgi:hypothetical protein